MELLCCVHVLGGLGTVCYGWGDVLMLQRVVRATGIASLVLWMDAGRATTG